MLRLPLLCAFLAAAIGLHAAEPAPAKIIVGDKATAVYIIEETLDGVQFVIDDPKSQIKATKLRSQYTRIEYGDTKDTNLLRGDLQRGRGDDAQAVESYRAAITSAATQWESERAVLRAAELLAGPKLNKPDDAIALLGDFISKNPRSARMPEAVLMRADLLLAKDDIAGASADYTAAAQNATAWNLPASRGLLGQAATLRKAKKPAEVVKLLATAITSLKAGSDDWADVGLALADNQFATGAKTEAGTTARMIAFSAAPVENRRAAFLVQAKVLADGATGAALATAFDHAALAAAEGANDATANAARALARDLVGRIEKDAAFSEAERKEYRTYLRTL
jgi:hypothetical protein